MYKYAFKHKINPIVYKFINGKKFFNNQEQSANIKVDKIYILKMTEQSLSLKNKFQKIKRGKK